MCLHLVGFVSLHIGVQTCMWNLSLQVYSSIGALPRFVSHAPVWFHVACLRIWFASVGFWIGWAERSTRFLDTPVRAQLAFFRDVIGQCEMVAPPPM